MLALRHGGRAQWTSAKWLAHSPGTTSEGRIYSPPSTDKDYKAHSLVTCLRPLDQEGGGLDLNPEPMLLTALLRCPKPMRAAASKPGWRVTTASGRGFAYCVEPGEGAGGKRYDWARGGTCAVARSPRSPRGLVWALSQQDWQSLLWRPCTWGWIH